MLSLILTFIGCGITDFDPACRDRKASLAGKSCLDIRASQTAEFEHVYGSNDLRFEENLRKVRDDSAAAARTALENRCKSLGGILVADSVAIESQSAQEQDRGKVLLFEGATTLVGECAVQKGLEVPDDRFPAR